MTELLYQSKFIFDPAKRALIEGVLDLCASHGAPALTARNVAERAGASAASINYHFGSIDELVSHANTFGDDLKAKYWLDWSQRLDELALAQEDFSGILFTTTRDITKTLPGAAYSHVHTLIRRARNFLEVPDIQTIKAERSFLQKLIQRTKLTHLDANALLAFSHALQFGYVIHHGSNDFDAWALALVTRFQERLLGSAPQSASDNAFRQLASEKLTKLESGMDLTHPTALKILKASVEVIMSEGADAITYRTIARNAGASVSSAQHFFKSKEAFLDAAYREIYTRIRTRSVPLDIPANSLSVEELTAPRVDRDETSHRQSFREAIALIGLLLSASKQESASVIARGMLANTGTSSMCMLGGLKNFRGELSRLDAQIYSMVLQQVWLLEYCENPAMFSSQESKLQAVGENIIRALFVE